VVAVFASDSLASLVQRFRTFECTTAASKVLGSSKMRSRTGRPWLFWGASHEQGRGGTGGFAGLHARMSIF